jgi:hypothetical protein
VDETIRLIPESVKRYIIRISGTVISRYIDFSLISRQPRVPLQRRHKTDFILFVLISNYHHG